MDLYDILVRASGTYENSIEGYARGTQGDLVGLAQEGFGTYNTNNGVVAAITTDGEYWVGPANKETINTLEHLGYTFDMNRYVPHSNDMGYGLERLFNSE